MVRRDAALVEVDWDEAIAKIASELKSFKKSEIAVLGSAFATNEDNYAIQRFAKEVLGTKNIDFMRHVVEGDEDNILIRADKTPNSTGAKAVGVVPVEGGMGFQEIIRGIKEGKIKALYALEDDLAAMPDVADALGKLEFFAVHAANESATTDLADVVLASSSYAEKNGTVTNFQERVQRIRPAVTTLEQDRALDGFETSRWDKFAAPNDSWGKGPRRDARPSWKIVAILVTLMGAKFKYNSSEEVFSDIAQKIDGFKGLSYLKVGNKGVPLKIKTGVAV
jgi:predicted molibdopterin-dependent oxidoreductase YjgC